jgi:hypothetical protein
MQKPHYWCSYMHLDYAVLINSDVSDMSHYKYLQSPMNKIQPLSLLSTTIVCLPASPDSSPCFEPPSPHGCSGCQSRLLSPCSQCRNRDHDCLPTRGHGQQTSQPNRTQLQSDLLFKALNNKDKKGWQGQERYISGYMWPNHLLTSYTCIGMGHCRFISAPERWYLVLWTCGFIYTNYFSLHSHLKAVWESKD